jgi:HSP20 family protein
MSLARWDPLLELRNIENEMNRLFRRQLAGTSRPEETLTSSQFAPPVDVYEDDGKISITMDVPGIDVKDVDIRVESNMLSVSGERKLETEERRKTSAAWSGSTGPFHALLLFLPPLITTTSAPILRMARFGSTLPNGPIREQSRSRLPRDRPEVRKLRNSSRNRAGALFTCRVFCNFKRRSR